MADANDHNNGSDEDIEKEVDVTEGGASAPKLAHVDTKSGEENYNELLIVKAKIWRFDEGENQWKERGQGDAKILQHKTKADRRIFIFRREGIGKLAANHQLVPGMRLITKENNDKLFVWITLKDFTDDDEGFPEKFTIKFQTKETADEFRRAFEQATKQ
jgi:Ran-binding protein 1